MTILQIDRTKPFDITDFARRYSQGADRPQVHAEDYKEGNHVYEGEGPWTIDGEDHRSLALSEVDLSKVSFKAMLEDGEEEIGGYEKMERLKKADHVCLDAKIFQTLWENQHLIPESWKGLTKGKETFIFFDGTVISNRWGSASVLYIHFNQKLNRWRWDSYWLDNEWKVNDPSAVIAS
jgi:hypothetical protein